MKTDCSHKTADGHSTLRTMYAVMHGSRVTNVEICYQCHRKFEHQTEMLGREAHDKLMCDRQLERK